MVKVHVEGGVVRVWREEWLRCMWREEWLGCGGRSGKMWREEWLGCGVRVQSCCTSSTCHWVKSRKCVKMNH